MLKEIAKFELQQNLESYLNTITSPDIRNKKQFICPLCKSGTGHNHTGALSIKIDKNGIPRATCFACNELRNSDIFETIGKVEGINNFKDQLNRAVELFNYPISKQTKPIKKNKNEVQLKRENYAKNNEPMKPKKLEDFNSFFVEVALNIDATNYLEERGINKATIQKYGIGYTENWIHPNSSNMKPKKGIIIPISPYSYIFRDIETKNHNYRYFKIRNRNNYEDKFFNFNVLTSSDKPVYIVEGEIDALSIISSRQNAVSLGSINNIKDFVESCKDLTINVPLIIFLDNDERGIKAAQTLRKGLMDLNLYRKNKGLQLILININDYETLKTMILDNKPFDGSAKDPNEVMLKLEKENKQLFAAYLYKYTNLVEESVKGKRTKITEEPKDDNEEQQNANEEQEINNKDVKAVDKTSDMPSNDYNEISNDYIKNVKLHINKFIDEQQSEILKSIHESKKTLLVSPMGTGKTKLIPSINKKKNAITVIVNPSVAQLQQMENEYNIQAVYGNLTYSGANIVCVTPESLKKKVIDKLTKPFVLIVDEAHEIYSSYNFRKAFANIKEVEKKALYTVYMSATPDILEETENFNTIIKVEKDEKFTINTTILEVDSLSTATKATIIQEYINKYSLVVLHNDNKKENETIAQITNKKIKVKTQLDNYFQNDIFGTEPQYDVHIKNTTATVNASKKESKAFQDIVQTNNIDKDIRLFCTTSCIQAGLNINNSRDTAIIYICNKESFKMVNFLQAVGRYRNKENVKEIILIKPKLDKKDHTFKNFSTIYSDFLNIAKGLIEINNNMYNNYELRILPQDTAENVGLEYDETIKGYKLNYHNIKAKAYSQYNKSLLYYTEILKRMLEDNKAIKLQVNIKQYDQKPTKEITEIIKISKKEIKKLFKETTSKMLECTDKELEEILEYNIDQRKIENQPLVKLMKNYHSVVTTTFKNTLNATINIKQISKNQAFRDIKKFETLKEAKEELLKIQINQINAEIKKAGIKTIFKAFKGYSRNIKKVIFIRYMLKNIEEKQGRITIKIKQTLLEQAIKLKLYKIKKPNDLLKAYSDLEKLINTIYKFDKQGKIQSARIDKKIK